MSLQERAAAALERSIRQTGTAELEERAVYVQGLIDSGAASGIGVEGHFGDLVAAYKRELSRRGIESLPGGDETLDEYEAEAERVAKRLDGVGA